MKLIKIGVITFLKTEKSKLSLFNTDAALKLNKTHIVDAYNKIINAAAVEP